jgi:hypothetical protein
VSVTLPSQDEGALGPSLLGTGDGMDSDPEAVPFADFCLLRPPAQIDFGIIDLCVPPLLRPFNRLRSGVMTQGSTRLPPK